MALLVGLAGCSGSHSRGQFQGHVVGKTESEIVSSVGKPDEIDAKDPAQAALDLQRQDLRPG